MIKLELDILFSGYDLTKRPEIAAKILQNFDHLRKDNTLTALADGHGHNVDIYPAQTTTDPLPNSTLQLVIWSGTVWLGVALVTKRLPLHVELQAMLVSKKETYEGASQCLINTTWEFRFEGFDQDVVVVTSTPITPPLLTFQGNTYQMAEFDSRGIFQLSKLMRGYGQGTGNL